MDSTKVDARGETIFLSRGAAKSLSFSESYCDFEKKGIAKTLYNWFPVSDA